MNSEEIILEQYKNFTTHKEKFVDRSFQTNKFYMILLLVLIGVMFITQKYTFAYGLSSTLIFSVAGMAISILWWINVDSYNFLVKIKLYNVIEELEKNFPSQPYHLEFDAIKELRKKKKMFLFSDIQKLLATLALLLFIVLFITEVTPILFDFFVK